MFYVPTANAETVKNAVFEAGGGRIGNYDRCCWQTTGTGQFRPLAGSQPFLGEAGVEEHRRRDARGTRGPRILPGDRGLGVARRPSVRDSGLLLLADQPIAPVSLGNGPQCTATRPVASTLAGAPRER